jgi:hypothetical protein
MKVISKIFKPLKMVFCSSREIVSLKFVKRLAGTPVYYSRSNVPSRTPVQMAGKYLEDDFREMKKNFIEIS